MNSQSIARQPHGRPEGGQFAETIKPSSGLRLVQPGEPGQFALGGVLDDHQPQTSTGYGPAVVTCSCGEWSAPSANTSADAYFEYATHLGVEVSRSLGVEDVDVADTGHVDYRLVQEDPRQAN
ncbi:hypothetical protein [Pseudactinotalea sp. Z1748]|uniref:hypothetical protein n=1 Tax=Pseudactinotalea sp. Z1748 TaxID=3413027 RepID=UPI003C7A05EE